MGRMLNLVDFQIQRARQAFDQGLLGLALPILRRLAKSPDLPRSQALELHLLYGATLFELRHYRLARRQFASALRIDPMNADAHYSMASAIQADPAIDARRAGKHFRRARLLSPNDPEILADAGAFSVQMGQTKSGLAMIRKAISLAPDDLSFVRTLVESLFDLDRVDDARRELQLARFRFAHDSRFQKLSAEFAALEARRHVRASEAKATVAGSSRVLPFLRVFPTPAQPAANKADGRVFRTDAGSSQQPHLRRAARRSDKSHAP